MIIEFILSPIGFLISTLIENLFTVGLPSSSGDITSLVKVIQNAMVFFPFDLFYLIISSVVFWQGAQFTWAVIEWVYKKIPGVD